MFSEEGKKVMCTACCEAAALSFTSHFWGNACDLSSCCDFKTYEGESVLETKFPHNPQWEKSV